MARCQQSEEFTIESTLITLLLYLNLTIILILILVCLALTAAFHTQCLKNLMTKFRILKLQ